MKSRSELLQRLGGEPPPDILIIGGGILTIGLTIIAFGGRLWRRSAEAVSR